MSSASSRVLLVAMVVAAIAAGIQLGGSPLLDADEGRNAEVGREMAVTNDYVVPRLDGLPYLDKPIIYFAAEAAFMEVLGPTELAARLPAYLFTLLTAVLVFWFARRRWGTDEASVATIAYLAMPLTIAFARTVIFDSALTFFIVAALMGLYEAVETETRRWATAAWIAIAFGVLTKGPVAIALPLLVAIPYAIWRKRARYLVSIGGLIAFVVIIAPWVWAMSQVIPEFLRYVVVTETAERMATKALKRTGPPWYFIPYVLAGALPWSIAMIASWKECKRRDPAIVYGLSWIIIPFVFFSMSQSKRPQYILPLMPAIALLIGAAWQTLRVRAAAIFFAFVGVVLLIAPFLPQFGKKMNSVILADARIAAWSLGALFVIGGLLAALMRRRDIAIVALALPIVAIPIATASLMDALGERRSARGFVAQLTPRLTPATSVVGVEAFTGSMAFYLRRPIIVASEDASEFTSNYLMRRYETFNGAPGSPLRSMQWLRGNIDQCCASRVFVVRNDDRQNRALFESRGIPLIATGPHHVAYGPYAGSGLPAAGSGDTHDRDPSPRE